MSSPKLHWYGKVSDKQEKPVVSSEQANIPSSKKIKSGKSSKTTRSSHLEHYTEDASKWLKYIAEDLDLEHFDVALKVLRSVLQVLRDRLNPAEVFDLSAQLPVIVRGILFEGYNLRDKPEKFDVSILLDHIRQNMGVKSGIDPEDAFRAVLKVMYAHVSKGELDDIYRNMPTDIQELWNRSRQGKPNVM